MITPRKIWGGLGNQMFEFAALYAYAREINTDFYFQDQKYFEKYKEEIKKLFSDNIGYLDQISIHVRRQDYLIPPHNNFHTDLTNTDYYERAIAFFPNDNFLVFSDDTEWCKEKWGNDKRFQIMEGGTEIEDMNLGASCKSQIIANSTFSYWQAYLCPNPAHIVIAPREDIWFKDNKVRIKLPKEWIKI